MENQKKSERLWIVDAAVFFAGAVMIAFKNYVLAGLDGFETAVATVGLVATKTVLGAYYERIIESAMRVMAPYAYTHFKIGSTLLRDIMYAVLQTVTFSFFVVFIAPPEKWLRAVVFTFIASAIMAPFVNRLVLPWARQLHTRLRNGF